MFEPEILRFAQNDVILRLSPKGLLGLKRRFFASLRMTSSRGYRRRISLLPLLPQDQMPTIRQFLTNLIDALRPCDAVIISKGLKSVNGCYGQEAVRRGVENTTRQIGNSIRRLFFSNSVVSGAAHIAGLLGAALGPEGWVG